jgi:V/A-type H+-transporting ATPase subunit I
VKPLIINHPEPMAKVRIITLKDSAEKTLKTLHKIGVMQVEEAKELKPVDRTAIEKEKKEVGELLTFASNVLNYLPEKKPSASLEEFEVTYTQPFKDISDEVRLLYSKVNKLQERISKLETEVETLTQVKKYLELFVGTPGLKLKDLNYNGVYLIARVFIFSAEAFKTSEEKLKRYILQSTSFPVENDVVTHVVAEANDQKALETRVSEIGGKVLSIPSGDSLLGEFLAENEKNIEELEYKISELKQELLKKAGEDIDRLSLLHEALAAENERLVVLEKAAEARYVSLIEGWVPESDVESVTAGVRENIEYVFIDTRKPESGEVPPSKLDNAAALKPFELIVKIFDIPKYGGWDPTPVVAYSFALFFGIMVSDFIYGLGLMVATKFLLPKFTDNPQSEGFKQFQKLLYTCSIVAVVIGALNGSYMGDVYKLFGLESLALVPAIGEMMGKPLSFVVLAIFIGLVHVNIAHLLGLIIGLKEKNKGVVLNRLALFLVQGGIPSLLHSLLRANVPFFNDQMYAISSYIMYVGIVLVIISELKMSGVLGGFLWIFDISGLFGDVISYSRLAGVGLASFYLGYSFNLILRLFPKIFPGAIGVIIGTLVGVILFVIGHVLNVVLCGLGGFVHSLRLCFVEFLTKFYGGGGREYSPFRLKRRAVEPASAKS